MKKNKSKISISKKVNCQLSIVNCRRGIAALPLVLMIGGLIAEIIIAMIVGNFLLTQSESGLRLSSEAFLAAQSGYQDAFIRIIRDKEFSGSYTLVFSGSSVDVTVCSDAPSPACAGLDKDKITVVGKSRGRNRKFEAILDVSQATGEATLESLAEVAA